MDYKKQAENLFYDAKDWGGNLHIRKDLYDAAQSITDLLAWAEAEEKEVEHLRESLDFARTKDAEIVRLGRALSEAEARAEKAEREREVAISDLKEISDCDYCKGMCNNVEVDDCRECSNETCKCRGCDGHSNWEWKGQKEE